MNTIKSAFNKINDYIINLLLRRNKFRDINKITTHLTIQEKYLLYKLSSKTTGIFVEIGSYIGASSCFISEGVLTSKKQSKLYCIDTWENQAMTEGLKETYNQFISNTKQYKNIIIPIKDFSYNAIKYFIENNIKIDFLFIDGDHSYEGVKKDWDLYSPLLKPNSIVLFHDIGWAKGVERVINEEVKRNLKKHGSLPNLFWGWIKKVKIN
ncbi:MAG TPA: class I SAM-dependent methyltransferase [Spirochaetota bacterium]|nr:class I SAM-dependent methyltransferase [Spirochaetota bacterium]HOS31644.1 class I SAM-dependent methyltransferase [Spirochaetota bacterium]HOS54904.1 class I SAM-dependent methyltransferase [Spirochaetota bacterium]HPK62070.1 class I SAM-dependent methyltransferase [Spirochaetota bacterium]HQF77246.1 class I SAM-dependent methyltransferase [Spirochaetota bacterium]